MTTTPPTPARVRDMDVTNVPFNELEFWPGNARRGDVEKIKESMLANGVFNPVIVQRSTNQVMVGNHRLRALIELNEEQPQDWPAHAPVIYLDVDDSEALRINLADNGTADAATWDERALLEQLRDVVAKEGDLRGTGFDLDFLEDLELHHGADDLDDLADEFGQPSDEDLWPTFSVKLPPLIHQQLIDALDAQPAEERPEQVRLLLARISEK